MFFFSASYNSPSPGHPKRIRVRRSELGTSSTVCLEKGRGRQTSASQSRAASAKFGFSSQPAVAPGAVSAGEAKHQRYTGKEGRVTRSIGQDLAPTRRSARPRRMIRPLSLLAGILGIVFLALATLYWLSPAGRIPAFLPGFEAGSAHVHLRHALGSLIVALVLFAFSWFQRGPGES